MSIEGPLLQFGEVTIREESETDGRVWQCKAGHSALLRGAVVLRFARRALRAFVSFLDMADVSGCERSSGTRKGKPNAVGDDLVLSFSQPNFHETNV